MPVFGSNKSDKFMRLPIAAFWLLTGFSVMCDAQEPTTTISAIEKQLVFPLSKQHNHAPGIVECPDGSLLVSWYRGSGERKADDVAVYGAWKKSGSKEWSKPFVMADRPGFPDCNTCMMIDRSDRLWLFWPTILANSWESCLTNYRVSSDYSSSELLEAGCPRWETNDLILLKPKDFSQQALEQLEEIESRLTAAQASEYAEEIATVKERLQSKLHQRLGWQPRCKPTILQSGRILLPLYTDTFSISIMAVSDDNGKSWYASAPLIGFGAIQPTVLERKDGTLAAYMRDNGPSNRIQYSESTDGGLTWSKVSSLALVNPGSGLDGVRLQDGRWLLVYNDSMQGRNSLVVAMSEDEGQTWPYKRHLENRDSGQFHYPVVIQAENGDIHVVYSYFVDEGKSMMHARFSPAWITDQAAR